MELYHWCACKLEELQKYFDHPNPINCRNGYSDIGDSIILVIITEVGDRLMILTTSLRCVFVTNITLYRLQHRCSPQGLSDEQ